MAEQPAGAIPLSVSENTPSGVADVVRKSVDKWLKNTEVVDILNKYKDYAFPISKDAPVTPPGMDPAENHAAVNGGRQGWR